MRIYLDLDSRLILSAPNRSIRSLEFKRRDNESLKLHFVRNGAVVQVSSGTVVKYGLKPVDQYAAGFFAAGSFSKTGTGESAVFTANLNLNTQPIAQAFYLEQKNISAMLEIETRDDDIVMSSATLHVTIENDVLRGDEAPPAVMPDGKATQAEAQAGLDNEKWMTPLRTKQAITQAASSYAPATGIAPTAITGTAVITTDSRLSNSRTPTAHKSSHATGGSDALTPADIGAATSAQGTKADSALQPSALTPYRTSAAQDTIDAGKASSTHDHDGRYYTETEIDTLLAGKQPTGSYATAAQGAKADSALQSVALTPYRSSAAQDLIDADKANISHTHSYNDLTNKPTLGTAAATASTSYATAAQGNKADSALQSGTAISNISGLQAAINSKADTSHTHSAATISASGFMSATDKAKLDGVATGATAYTHPSGDGNLHVPATGTTNNGSVLKAGATPGSAAWASLSKGDVGLGNCDNTSDANKPISTATQTALSAKSDTSHTHSAATISASGFMSQNDKARLDTMESTSGVNVIYYGDVTALPLTGTMNGRNAYFCQINPTDSYSVYWDNARWVIFYYSVSYDGPNTENHHYSKGNTNYPWLADWSPAGPSISVTLAYNLAHRHNLSDLNGITQALDAKLNAGSDLTGSSLRVAKPWIGTQDITLGAGGIETTAALGTTLYSEAGRNATAGAVLARWQQTKQVNGYVVTATIGSITATSGVTGVAYNTTSDYRLKTNLEPLTGAVDRLSQIPVHRFNWMADPEGPKVDGFLAHEAQAVVPESVVGAKDAEKTEEYEVTPETKGDDGKIISPAVMGTRIVPDYQGIDQSKLVPLLVAAIQELSARLAVLEASNMAN